MVQDRVVVTTND